MPFEYMTPFGVAGLGDHTAFKSKEELETHIFLALAHGGASLVIDAIDPVGTLNPLKYELLGEVFNKTSRYEPYLGGSLCQDVGIYYNQLAKFNLEDCGKKADMLATSGRIPHQEAAKGAARALKENHIPFGVIGTKNLKDLRKYKVLILPNVLKLEEAEANYIREYVENGGSVYASGFTAPELLAGLFGISYEGETVEKFTYMSPTSKGISLIPGVSRKYPLTVYTSQLKVKALNLDEVMATVTLPYTNPHDTGKFASIHSNPPGIETGYPSLIYRQYGNGKVIWSAAPIEEYNVDLHKSIFATIVTTLAAEPFTFEVKAHPSVEAVMFHQPEIKRYIVSFINVQQTIPPVPVTGITFKLRLNDQKVKRVTLLPEGKELCFSTEEDCMKFDIPSLEIFHMAAVEYC